MGVSKISRVGWGREVRLQLGAGEGQAQRLLAQMIKPLTHHKKLQLVTYGYKRLCPLCRAVAVLSLDLQGGRKTLQG